MLVPVTLHRARFRDRRSVAAVVAALSRDPASPSAQANHVYALVGDATPALPGPSTWSCPPEGGACLGHRQGRDGRRDRSRRRPGAPSLQGAVADRHDALDGGKPAAAHPHGTAIAGIVGARAQLASAAPGSPPPRGARVLGRDPGRRPRHHASRPARSRLGRAQGRARGQHELCRPLGRRALRVPRDRNRARRRLRGRRRQRRPCLAAPGSRPPTRTSSR